MRRLFKNCVGAFYVQFYLRLTMLRCELNDTEGVGNRWINLIVLCFVNCVHLSQSQYCQSFLSLWKGTTTVTKLISSEDNCPWASIASLALHKLYTDWQSQGYTLPKVQQAKLVFTNPKHFRSLRICQLTLEPQVVGAQVFLMLTKMPSRWQTHICTNNCQNLSTLHT